MSPFKTFAKWAGILFLAIIHLGAVSGLFQERRSRLDAEQRARYEKIINDSTRARSVLLSAQRDSFRSLYEAAKVLDGKVVGGVRIVVRSDTIRVPVHIVETDTVGGGTRRAMLSDTTAHGYQVTVRAEAPPSPAPLQIGYDLVTPEFRPEVGFVRSAAGYDAVVTWAGQSFTVDRAFFVEPGKERSLSLVAGSDILASPSATTTGATVRGDAYIGAKYRWPERFDVRLKAGWGGSPYVGVGLERRIW